MRDSMSRMIEAWKEIPDIEEEELSSCTAPASLSQRRSSLAGDAPNVEHVKFWLLLVQI